MSEEREARNEVDEWIATAAWHLGKNVLTIDEKRIAYFAWRECQERNTRAQSSQAERVKKLEAENARLGKANNILCLWKSEIDQRRIILGLPFPVDYDDSPKYAVRSLIEALNQKGGE